MLEVVKKYVLWIIAAVLIIFGIGYFLPDNKNEVKQENIEVKNLSALTIEPTEKHTKTVIFLHGLGDDAEHCKSLLRQTAINNPHVKFIFPQAPRIFMNMSYYAPILSWYNIKGNIKDIMNLKQDKKGLLKTVSQIEQIIQKEIDNGISPEKIIVSGHSQGGSVALALGLVSSYQVDKIMCLSGFLPCREEIFDLAKEENKNIPFKLYHKRDDDTVPYIVGEKSTELLKDKRYRVEFEKVKDNHQINSHFYTYLEVKEIFKEELN